MVLRRTGYSPNIKERLDFSCALFNAEGALIAQAAHIPAHLGAMPMSVLACLEALEFSPGDVAVLNDPFHGGNHLPDITMVTPIFSDDSPNAQLLGFSANRAHHSDVGGMSPGSMPLSREIYQEGIIIPPLKLVEHGNLNQPVMDIILANVRTPTERAGDLRAQIAANGKGVERLRELVRRYGVAEVQQRSEELLAYAERMTRRLIADLPDGTYAFSDFMDDDGIEPEPVKLQVTITVAGDEVTVDFSGTSQQVTGSINAVYAITMSAVFYAFRALIELDIPSNSGCFAPIRIIAPEGTLLNARAPAAVAGGNVETSQRATDVLLGALAQVRADRIPAASQGTMNNLTIGGWDPGRQQHFAYYETIGGGMGARPGKNGADGIHTHMTNTLNTPIEALEYAYPFRVKRYELRRGSGGRGQYRGGDGVVREIELLADATITMLSERRRTQPYGLAGGQPGANGRNILIQEDKEEALPGKFSRHVRAGNRIRVETPGGGGHGPPPADE